jgi:hypothetical protein
MEQFNKIYNIYPQMEFYNESLIAKKRLVPYAMISSQKNYENKCVKTCSRGFRISSNGLETFSVDQINKYKSINIVVGGSTVFGVGSSNNQNTIPSLLSLKTNSIWLNLGIRAGNSFSEYIHLINLLHKANKIDNIIFLSGLNDLYLSFLYNNETEFDPGFFPDTSESKNNSLFRKITQFFSQKVSDGKNNLYQDMITSTEVILENYKNKYIRNFQLISSLKNTYNCKVKFILQPFAPWTNKKFSKNELEVFDLLNDIQDNSGWIQIKNLMGNNSLYKSIDDFFILLSKHYNLEYIDSNSIFTNTKSDCFVDSVHLNDNGNKLLTELIYDQANN